MSKQGNILDGYQQNAAIVNYLKNIGTPRKQVIKQKRMLLDRTC